MEATPGTFLEGEQSPDLIGSRIVFELKGSKWKVGPRLRPSADTTEERGGRVICVDNAYKRVDESCANNVSSAQSLEIRVCVDGCWLWAGENAVNALQERGDPVQPPTLALVRLM